MPRNPFDNDLQQEQGKLARYLMGIILVLPAKEAPEGTPEDSLWNTNEEVAAWRKARLMLKAEDLLQAAQFALAVFSKISSEQFAKGGDRKAREMLRRAIEDVLQQPFSADKQAGQVYASIQESIRENAVSA